MFGPFNPRTGRAIPLEEQDLTKALRANRPAHARTRIRSLDGGEHDIEVSGLPIVGGDGFTGAMIFFWPADPDAPTAETATQ